MPAPAFAIKADRDQLVIDGLTARFGDQIAVEYRPAADAPKVIAGRVEGDMLVLHVHKAAIHAVLGFLRDELDFNFLTSLGGMHHADRDALGLVFHLHSMRSGHRIRLKTETALKDPVFPTFTDLWPTANWMEREAWDFFGITFAGHPGLKRILNMEDFPAFPLRKDYPLEDPTREDKDDSYFGR
jgi:NADH-quinone oxidoreductase subunit C